MSTHNLCLEQKKKKKHISQTCPYNKLQYFIAVKNDNLQMKKCASLLIFAQNIDRGYTLEPPHRGGSNEYPCFRAKIR